MGHHTRSSVDWISELPDFVLHHILSFLPSKVDARTCVLSKRWQHIWETYPILDLDESYFKLVPRQFYSKRQRDGIPEDEQRDGIPEDEQRMIHNQRVKFMNYVDYRLQRFSEGNLCIKKFRLYITLMDITLTPRIDAWLELVSHLNVQELDLRIPVGDFEIYSLPPGAVASRSMSVLCLQACEVSRCVGGNSTKLRTLVEIEIGFAFFKEETIINLLSCCPSLEAFSVDRCWGFERLTISGHRKLKKMKFCTDIYSEVENFSIEAPSLEEVDFSVLQSKDKKEVCDISVSSSCQNLKCLSLEGIPLCGKWLHQMITPFPQLEVLKLDFCKVLDDVFKLSNTVLKEVRLAYCSNMMEGHFDTPNLQNFDYFGNDMPRLSTTSVTSSGAARLLVTQTNTDSRWFAELNSFLKYGVFQNLELILHPEDGGGSIYYDLVDCFGREDTAPFQLEKLYLDVMSPSPINYSALLDGLLCNLHPKMLSVKLDFISAQHVQEIFKRMICRNPKESPLTHKCWRNLLKDIEFAGIKGSKFDVGFDSGGMELLKSFCDNYDTLSEPEMKLVDTAFDNWIALAGELPGVDCLYFKLLW